MAIRDRRAIGKKAAATLKARNPNYYRDMGRLGSKARKNPYYHFKVIAASDPEELRSISSKGGSRTPSS